VPSRRLSAVLVAAAVAAYAGERWTARTRATGHEKRGPLPGDELVPEPKWQATRAVTVQATAEEVWPWLVQMGFPTHRAGWYIPHWMDRVVFGIRARSAERIVPELQDLAVGDRVPDSERGASHFTVARIDPARALVLHSHTHPLPFYEDVSFAWAFVLVEAGPPTRLIMRARVSYTPVWPAIVVRLVFVAGFGIGDVVQAGAMLGGIRRRAERIRTNY
jgi:hypothetical protein